jgi:hypothetical protein
LSIFTANSNITGLTTVSSNILKYDNVLKIAGEHADIEINGVSLIKTIESINEKLCIITPDLQKLEKYAALKNAYEHYKLIETLCRNGE